MGTGRRGRCRQPLQSQALSLDLTPGSCQTACSTKTKGLAYALTNWTDLEAKCTSQLAAALLKTSSAACTTIQVHAA